MRYAALIAALIAATPAAAATGPFLSLGNTDFIVLLGFLLFIAVLIYFGVPGMLMGMLDKRADQIRSELDEAKSLREEAQALLASYERKQKEVQAQADRIVETARKEASDSAAQAKLDLEASIQRRLAAAEDQIASAEASAVKEVKDRAVAVAIAAAREVIAGQVKAADANKMIDDSIDTVEQKLH
ncbi:ATP synthase F0, B subunit [Pseudooceanicola batsensis HTCC2597]|uniref:ATP synthase subunit b n=1 Tax=Pseudooceanicola batsensis (strain ATCC BAA-863 / DSM 15984 / KCTC 12145 / HTCC2597) TaxID=252305 RepID=A3TVJ0_PSEBH|nr:F0F1 ATP synthase subunit B [Pseudooceanicola batsensis]EAQ04536.1 ATP synthase F0, B subunit [Pseudooceanicola batsensis HTCC2597]